MKQIHYFILLLFLSAIAVHGEGYCSLDDGSSCSIEDGKLTMGQLETQAYLSAADDQVCIVYFYSETCSHCKAISPLVEELAAKYEGQVHLTKFEVSDPENIKLYNQLCQARGYDGKSIPLIGINDIILVGETQIREGLQSEIIRGINSSKKICPLGGMTCHADSGNLTGTNSDTLIPGMSDLKWTSVMPVIIFAGLGDGINPCAFIILIFVMVFLQQISGSRRKLIRITLAYIISLVATNIVLGIFYFTLSIQLGFPTFVRSAVISISIIAGIINLKDFFWYGKGVSLGIPKVTKRYLKRLINKASVPSAILLGASVGILEAPCSVPIYLAVIEVLKGEGRALASVFPYILMYNLMFILPLVTLAFLVYFGYKAKAFEEQSLESKRYMKLVIGIILIGLAAALLMGWL